MKARQIAALFLFSKPLPPLFAARFLLDLASFFQNAIVSGWSLSK